MPTQPILKDSQVEQMRLTEKKKFFVNYKMKIYFHM